MAPEVDTTRLAPEPRAGSALPAEPPKGAEECNVCVAVHVRPLIHEEIIQECKETISVTPNSPQVTLSSLHQFTFDYVYGGDHGRPPSELYGQCVKPLVEGLFRGYNATVLAYGQTGSGKTYTMGSAFTPGGPRCGVIPEAMTTLFEICRRESDMYDFSISASFVEIYREDIRDLLAPAAPPVSVRELPGGGVCLAGATEQPVGSMEDMAQLIERGTLCRATSATGMNKRSSRSHAIFTISLEKRRRDTSGPSPSGPAASDDSGGAGLGHAVESPRDATAAEDEVGEADYVCAKMHLVDLAGSERAKRTKAEGVRLKEGIKINQGLFALGKVISALCDDTRRGAHVPYRESRLTRLLQDSLGGNSRTVMLACVSPADVNFEETLSTLKYADRARMIRNKPTVNRDPMAAEVSSLRQQLALAKAELAAARAALCGAAPASVASLRAGGGDAAWEAAVTELEARAQRAEAEVSRLQAELRTATSRLVEAQAQRDAWEGRCRDLLDKARERGWDARADLQLAGEEPSKHGAEVYLGRIAELEGECARLKNEAAVTEAFLSARRMSIDLARVPEEPLLEAAQAAEEDGVGAAMGDEVESAVEEQVFLAEQSRLGMCMEDLNRQLRAKEEQVRQMSQVSVVKAVYEKKLAELEDERGQLEDERSRLSQAMRDLKKTGAVNATEREAKHRQRLAELEGRLRELERERARLRDLERTKARAEEACKRLEEEIRGLKQHKVQLSRQMEAAAKEFQEFKRTKEKEMMQLRRAGQRGQLQVERMRALHEKQQQVLRRKTEEADAARRRLKELTMRQAAVQASRPQSASSKASDAPECQPHGMAPLLRDERSREEWVEGEMAVVLRGREIERVLSGETAQRAALAQALQAKRQELRQLGQSPEAEAVRGAVASMEARIAQHTADIRDLQEQLGQARVERGDEKSVAASDVRRWSGIRNTIEGRTMLRTLFRVAVREREARAETEEALVEAKERAELLTIEVVALKRELAEALRQKAAAEAASHAALEMAKKVATPSKTRPLQDATNAEGPGAAARSGPGPMPPRSPLSEALAGGLARATANGVWQSVSLDPRRSVPAEEVHRIVRDMRRAERRVLTAASDTDSGSTAPGGADSAGAARLNNSPSVEGAEDSEMFTEEEEEEEGEDERDVAWDPSMATPAMARRGAGRARAAAGHASPRGRSGEASAGSSRGSGGGAAGADRAAWERPVLARVNAERAERGMEPASRLTVRTLREHLTGRIIGGKVWRAGRKDRDQMVADFRALLGLPTVPEGSLPPAEPSSSAGGSGPSHGASRGSPDGSQASVTCDRGGNQALSISLSGGISGQQTPHLRPNHPRADPARWADAVADLPPAPVADAQQDVEMMDCDASPLPARPQGPPPGARRYASGASDLPSASEGATGGSAGVACASPDSEGPSSASTGASSRTQHLLQRAQASRERAEALLTRALSGSTSQGSRASAPGATPDAAQGSPSGAESGLAVAGSSAVAHPRVSPRRSPLSPLSPNSVHNSPNVGPRAKSGAADATAERVAELAGKHQFTFAPPPQ